MGPSDRVFEPAVSTPPIDAQREYWDDRWDKTRTPNDWALRRAQTIVSYLLTVSLARPRILDIGCGTGWFTNELSRIGDVTGIDLSETAIALAKSQYPDLDFIAGDLYEQPFSSASYDVIVAQEVLPHVQDQPIFIEILRQIMKPRGYLVLSMVNKFVIDRIEWDHGPPSHIVRWLTMQELSNLLHPKFRILKSGTIIPMGNRGILRLVNSCKLNRFLRVILRAEVVDAWKEKAGCGLTRVVLAQRTR